MGKKLDKFLLLMWKNWLLQYRRPIQTLFEIFAPVLFSVLLVVIRSLVDPDLHGPITYPSFCTIPVLGNDSVLTSLCPNAELNELTSLAKTLNKFNFKSSRDSPNDTQAGFNFSDFTFVYSPRSEGLKNAMDFFHIIFGNVVQVEDSAALDDYFVRNSTNLTFAALQFDDSYKGITNLTQLNNLKVSIRFPSETRIKFDTLGQDNWLTNLIYPIFQMPGPRQFDSSTGAAPSYYGEGFLGIQHFLTLSVILARNGVTPNIIDIVSWLSQNNPPLIEMRRFPYAVWYEDFLLTALKTLLPLLMMLSFVYTCINTVKTITTEKERQLKEAMKIMGLSNWLHWTAWFVKTFMYLLLSIILIVVLLKVKWYTNTDFTVFTYADASVMLVFLLFYICSTITFCFAVSVFFSKANTAATIAGLTWFLCFAPFLFLQEKYETLSLSTKLASSLGSNSAMAFGFQVMLMYEGTGEGVQWNNLFRPNTPDDNLSLGLVMIMLLVDTFIYLILALYVEAVFPGDYGVARPWYFPFTSSFWCGEPRYKGIEDFGAEGMVNEGEYFEAEPQTLPAGIHIRNLRKVYGKKAAVRNLSLNMYEGQITVLLGHNGAGKTTTMSMLTGMITPNSGTAKVNGYDIRLSMGGVRSSLGLCPQHNIIFDELTVSEHFYFFSKLKGLSKSEIKAEIDKYVDLLELEPKRNAKSSTLSGGMKRKLCVGMALCGDSKVVMLDEPTAGMDPSARRALWDLLQTQKEGRTMLLTTHFMDEADLLGDRIAIMAGGDLKCCGSSFFLKKKYGAGYSLIMDKSKDCDVGRVTQFLRSHIPEIEVHNNVGSELTYLLVESQSSLFEPMLHDLEQHSGQLGIRSYGISLTTLEEVFLKVGAEHGQEDMYDQSNTQNGFSHDLIFRNGSDTNGEIKINIALRPSFTGGYKLLQNQFIAMVMKKWLSTFRTWILLLVQILMPMLFLIIAVIVVRTSAQTGNLPKMPLNLDKFDDPITLIENVNNMDYAGIYKSVLKDFNYRTEDTSNLTSEVINLTATIPNTVRRRYVTGASFESGSVYGINITNITAWFNNDAYHTPGITLGFVLNAMFRKMLSCSDCSIEFDNFPMPYTPDTQINQLLSGQGLGFQLAFNVGFSMAFVASFYVLFTVRENVSKSKHLQFVSGVKVYVFWVTALLCDMVTYLITVIVLLITLVIFQEEGYDKAEDIGRMFLILFYFGWAFMPLMYLVGYLFSVPSTGYTRMTLFNIFSGVAAFLVVQVLTTPGLNLEYVGDALHWVFLIFPHYSLATGMSESYKMYSYSKLCAVCPGGNCFNSTDLYHSICDGMDGNYYKWQAPGIGRNIMYSFVTGTVLFILLLTIEYEVFGRIRYFIEQKRYPHQPMYVENEDSDVAEEKQKIRNTSEQEIRNTYTMALRDLTKYYKNLLAVNSLCLGVQNYECFGLLGVNGAGKTTTFKMLTGDVKVSSGDGWVNGFSIKSQIKQVQKAVGYCPQFDALLDDMTAKETITMFSLLRGIRYSYCASIAENLAREFDFLPHLNKKVKELSGGNKRKLSTSISLIGDPPVIYLDEPTTGMDPATKRYLWNALCKIRDTGKCIVLTSHSMEECEALCTRLAIMVNGSFKCLGSTQHLKNKFAEGYTLVIKMKKLYQDPIAEQADIQRIEDFIQEHFPGAKSREKHQELLNYYITNKSVPWSKMFGVLEQAKRSDLNIEDYSLGQSSLEQVFLTFTRQQYITG